MKLIKRGGGRNYVQDILSYEEVPQKDDWHKSPRRWSSNRWLAHAAGLARWSLASVLRGARRVVAVMRELV